MMICIDQRFGLSQLLIGMLTRRLAGVGVSGGFSGGGVFIGVMATDPNHSYWCECC